MTIQKFQKNSLCCFEKFKQDDTENVLLLFIDTTRIPPLLQRPALQSIDSYPSLLWFSLQQHAEIVRISMPLPKQKFVHSVLNVFQSRCLALCYQ